MIAGRVEAEGGDREFVGSAELACDQQRSGVRAGVVASSRPLPEQKQTWRCGTCGLAGPKVQPDLVQ